MELPARLEAVGALIRRGATQEAKDALTALAEETGADRFIDRIVALAIALNDPDIVDPVLDRALPEGAYPRSRRMPFELEIADAYIGKGMRREAFRHLRKLIPLYRGDTENLHALAVRLAKLGENSLALEVLEPLAKGNPGDRAIERSLVRSLTVVKQNKGLERMAKFLHREGATADDWQFAAETFYNYKMSREAIDAAQRSLAMGGDILKNRRLLADIAVKYGGNHKKAADEIRSIPVKDVKNIFDLRQLANLAFAWKDKSLALKIAEEQWSRKEDEARSALFLVNHLVWNDEIDRARAIVDELFPLLEKRNALGRKDFARLAEICFKTFHSDALELRAIEAGLKQFPDDDPLLKLKTQLEARRRFVANHSATGKPAPASPKGLLDRFRRRSGGSGDASAT